MDYSELNSPRDVPALSITIPKSTSTETKISLGGRDLRKIVDRIVAQVPALSGAAQGLK